MDHLTILETEIRSILTMGLARMESFGVQVLVKGYTRDETDKRVRLFWTHKAIQDALASLAVAALPAPAQALENIETTLNTPEEETHDRFNLADYNEYQAPLGFPGGNLAESWMDNFENPSCTDGDIGDIGRLGVPSTSPSSDTMDMPPSPNTSIPMGQCQNCLSNKPEIVCYDCGDGAFCNHECWCNAHLIRDKHQCVEVEKPQPAAHLLAFVTRGKLPLGSAREQFFFHRCSDDSGRSILCAIYRHLYTQYGLNAFQLQEWKDNNSLHKNIVQTFNEHPERVPSTYAHWLREHPLVFAGEDTSEILLPRVFRCKIRKASPARVERRKRQRERRKMRQQIKAGGFLE